jgi:uncharacterized protein
MDSKSSPICAQKRMPNLFTRIHLWEVYYITRREKDQKNADLAYFRIKKFPLKYIDTIDETLLLKAATLKADFPISYADAFVAAVAEIYDAVLLTGDPEFKVLEQREKLKVHWLNR